MFTERDPGNTKLIQRCLNDGPSLRQRCSCVQWYNSVRYSRFRACRLISSPVCLGGRLWGEEDRVFSYLPQTWWCQHLENTRPLADRHSRCWAIPAIHTAVGIQFPRASEAHRPAARAGQKTQLRRKALAARGQNTVKQPVIRLHCSAKPKGSICLLVKWADTAFCLCTAVKYSSIRNIRPCYTPVITGETE